MERRSGIWALFPVLMSFFPSTCSFCPLNRHRRIDLGRPSCTLLITNSADALPSSVGCSSSSWEKIARPVVTSSHFEFARFSSSLHSVHRLTNNPFLFFTLLFRGMNHFPAAQRLSYYSVPPSSPTSRPRRSRWSRSLEQEEQSLARKSHGLEKMGGRDETAGSDDSEQGLLGLVNVMYV